MIFGVCGWLAGKTGWKESYIRIGFVVGALVFGVGLTIYLVLLIVKLFSK